MEQATFSFTQCVFTDVEIHMLNATDSLSLQLHPEGIYDVENKTFNLILDFRAKSEKDAPDDLLVSVRCVSKFKMDDSVCALNDVPKYFYANSVAIVFPYLRAFISSLTIQANARPIVLPTMNLSSLGEDLKKNSRLVAI